STTATYTLSLHDALPICRGSLLRGRLALRGTTGDAVLEVVRELAQIVEHAEHLGRRALARAVRRVRDLLGDLLAQPAGAQHLDRSEEHTSELQSRGHLVC